MEKLIETANTCLKEYCPIASVNGLGNCEVYGLPFIFVTLMNKLDLSS